MMSLDLATFPVVQLSSGCFDKLYAWKPPGDSNVHLTINNLSRVENVGQTCGLPRNESHSAQVDVLKFARISAKRFV